MMDMKPWEQSLMKEEDLSWISDGKITLGVLALSPTVLKDLIQCHVHGRQQENRNEYSSLWENRLNPFLSFREEFTQYRQMPTLSICTYYTNGAYHAGDEIDDIVCQL
jgi:hypothetical protein